ncbi:Pol polyprotein [Vitis vinifera]|uniref:Pol polyprotein n=1 Tax=Vitis vinifera TaxID=29760 RepID=A0A438ECC0_VITVI|nr:Pol polyprotein [Vitis vinifera]
MTEYSVHLISRLDPLRYLFDRPALVGRLMRWLVLLTEFDIHYVTQKSIRGSIVADHLASLPVSDTRAIDDDFPDEDVAAVTSPSGWRMYFDGAANHSGYGIDVLLISPHDDHIPRSVRLAFSDRHPTTNNIVEYEACILGLETALELGIRQMEVFGDSNLVLRQIQGEWKTRDVKLKPYHAYLELLVGRFDDLRYTHLPRAQNQFADALATLASMIDIPVNATVQPLLGVYPEAATAKDKRALRQLATRFVICGETLYKRSPDGVLLLCLDRASADRVMREVHAGVCGPHMGGHMLARKIMRTRYFWLTMETDCCQFVQRCPECQIHGDLIHVPPSELHALTSPWPFSIWGIDIIGKISPKSSSGHEFILVAIDYFTKWVEVASYARLTSAGVASFIISHIICRYGVPHELISNRGVHFRAEVDTLVQRYSIRHHRSSAYRPQMNGAVEAANRNIRGYYGGWSRLLGIGATPYSLAYGMEAMLPVEIEMGSLRVALEQQIPEADWAQAQFDQLNLLDERRLRAADHVRAYQRKMARAFKKRVKPRPLHGVDPRGAVWLMDLDGNRFSEPTNVDQLKSDPSQASSDPWLMSFLSFLSPYHLGLRYVPCLKTTLRPWDQMSSSAASTWAAPEIHPARSALLDTWMSSCLSIWEVTCAMMDDFMTFVLRTCRAPDAILGHIPFRRIFMDLCRGAYFGSDEIYRSWGSRVPILIWRDVDVRLHFVRILRGASLESFSQIHTLLYSRDSSMELSLLPGFPASSFQRALNGVSFETRRVPFSHFQRIEICSGMPHWGHSPFSSLCLGHPPTLESSSSLLSFGVQSHHHFLVSAFRAITVFTVRRSEPSLVFRSTFRVASSISTFRVVIASQFDVQGHHHRFLVSAFRAITVFTVRRSEPSSVFRSTFRVTSSISTFRVVIASQFDVQGHHHRFLVSAFRAITVFTVRRSEPSSVFRSTFRVASSILTFRVVIASQFDVQILAFRAITIFSLAFKAIVAFRFWRSEPSSLFSVRRSEPSSLFSFGVQSHHHFLFSVQSHRRFSVLAFRAIVAFQFWRSEPSLFLVWRSEPSSLFSFGVRSHHYSQYRSHHHHYFQFGVQSHHHYFQFGVQSHRRFSVLAFRAIAIFSLAFRAIIAFQFWRSEPSLFSVWRSEPSSLFSFGVRSHHYSQYRSHHHHFSVLAFGAISSFHSAFRAITTSQFRCPEPSPLLRLAFRAIVITPQFDVHSHIHQYRLSEPSSHLRSAFRAIVITSQFWRSEPSLLHSLFR